MMLSLNDKPNLLLWLLGGRGFPEKQDIIRCFRLQFAILPMTFSTIFFLQAILVGIYLAQRVDRNISEEWF
jgi:hypothetical protein